MIFNQVNASDSTFQQLPEPAQVLLGRDLIASIPEYSGWVVDRHDHPLVHPREHPAVISLQLQVIPE